MYFVYTDGGCRGNGKQDAVGAWAFIVYEANGKRVGSKSQATRGTTNNRMEMQAVLETLKWANKFKNKVTIHLDSNFVKQGCETWVFSWARKGWKKADDETPANKEMWAEILEQLEQYGRLHNDLPTFVKVKGHSGDAQNDEVDALCNVKMTELELEDM